MNNATLKGNKHWVQAIYQGRGDVRPIDLALAQQLCDSELLAGSLVKDTKSGAWQAEQEQLKLLADIVISLSQNLSVGNVCIKLSDRQLAELPEFNCLHRLPADQYQQAFDPFEYEIDFPLILAGPYLYFSRYWFYERQIYFSASRHNSVKMAGVDHNIAETLNALFPAREDGAPDWQMLAAANTCLNQFSVITGGPGTGKTTTVTRLLTVLLTQNPDLKIALAAPTGKAAARLTESIRGAKSNLINDYPIAIKIPEDSFTLHRLLAWTPDGYRHNHNKPLPYDLVMVDEASMVDLPMMANLMEALPEHCRLILLGDKDQLASVEAGSVLADLCDSGVIVNDYPAHGLTEGRAQQLQALCGQDGRALNLQPYIEENASLAVDALMQLRVSYRFDSQSGIGQLAKYVNQGDSSQSLVQFERFSDIHKYAQLPALYADSSAEPKGAESAWMKQVVAGYGEYLNKIQQGAEAQQVLNAFNNFQLLCAIREGHQGLHGLNERVLNLLSSKGLLAKPETGRWYPGRPVMVIRNDYELNLFNGDIGITMLVDGELRVCFPDPQDPDKVRNILPSRLPEHETAFAMTVHKSQGSEFADVALVLPEKDNPVITRELIYTGITRAKKSFSIYANDSVLMAGISRRVVRASGLRDLIFNR